MTKTHHCTRDCCINEIIYLNPPFPGATGATGATGNTGATGATGANGARTLFLKSSDQELVLIYNGTGVTGPVSLGSFIGEDNAVNGIDFTNYLNLSIPTSFLGSMPYVGVPINEVSWSFYFIPNNVFYIPPGGSITFELILYTFNPQKVVPGTFTPTPGSGAFITVTNITGISLIFRGFNFIFSLPPGIINPTLFGVGMTIASSNLETPFEIDGYFTSSITYN